MRASECQITAIIFVILCFIDYGYRESELLKSINNRFETLQTVASQDHIGASLAIGFHGNIDSSFKKFSDYKVSGAYLIGNGKRSVIIPGNLFGDVPEGFGIWTSETDLWFSLDLGNGYKLLLSNDKLTSMSDHKFFEDFSIQNGKISTTADIYSFIKGRYFYLLLYFLAPFGLLELIVLLVSFRIVKREATDAREDSEYKTHDAKSKAIDDYLWPAYRIKAAYEAKNWSDLLHLADDFQTIGEWNHSVWGQNTKVSNIQMEEFNLYNAIQEVLNVVKKSGLTAANVKVYCQRDLMICTSRIHFMRLIFNCIVNAIKACQYSENYIVNISAIEGRDKIKIFVSNHGKITQSMLEKGQSEVNSTGLGTKIIKEIGDSLKANLLYINTNEKVSVCFEISKVRSPIYCY